MLWYALATVTYGYITLVALGQVGCQIILDSQPRLRRLSIEASSTFMFLNLCVFSLFLVLLCKNS